MMNSEMVREFHEKHEIPVSIQLSGEWDVGLSTAKIHTAASAVILLRAFLHTNDDRLLRAHLMCEELSEILDALLRCDEVGLLDGLADLEYVTTGTAVTFGLPLDAAFIEVHRSNMTKKVTVGSRIRDKGEDYSPPDIEGVIRCARS